MTTAVIVGASGACGRLVVNVLAKDTRISKITAVVRSEQPAAFWFLEGSAEWAKVELLVVPDLKNLPAKLEYDIGFCCIGLYSANKPTEAFFEEVEVGLNTKAAEAMKAGGCQRCCYLSGAGVAPSKKFPMFSRVKGKAEASLKQVGLPNFATFRPPGIMDRVGKRVYGPPESVINSCCRCCLSTSAFVRAEDIAWAMVQYSFAPADGVREIYEAGDIKAAAKAFAIEQQLSPTRYQLGM